jgi:hypothetical protein
MLPVTKSKMANDDSPLPFSKRNSRRREEVLTGNIRSGLLRDAGWFISD